MEPCLNPILSQSSRPSTLSNPLGLSKRKIKVLLIDDDPFYQRLVATALDSRYFQVDCFNSLEEIGHISKIGHYDMAVLDHYLPQVSGLEIAEYVDAFFRKMPIILISGGQPGKNPGIVWPGCIRKYVPKGAGIPALVEAVMEIAVNGRLIDVNDDDDDERN